MVLGSLVVQTHMGYGHLHYSTLLSCYFKPCHFQLKLSSVLLQLWLFFAAFTLILFSKCSIWNPSFPDAFLLLLSIMYMWLLTTKYISLTNICAFQMFVVMHALSSKTQKYRHRDNFLTNQLMTRDFGSISNSMWLR